MRVGREMQTNSEVFKDLVGLKLDVARIRAKDRGITFVNPLHYLDSRDLRIIRQPFGMLFVVVNDSDHIMAVRNVEPEIGPALA